MCALEKLQMVTSPKCDAVSSSRGRDSRQLVLPVHPLLCDLPDDELVLEHTARQSIVHLAAGNDVIERFICDNLFTASSAVLFQGGDYIKVQNLCQRMLVLLPPDEIELC